MSQSVLDVPLQNIRVFAGKKRFGLPGHLFRPTISNLDKQSSCRMTAIETREQALRIKEIRRWWQIKTGRVDTPFDSEIPFWIVSFCFHAVLLVVLARLFCFVSLLGVTGREWALQPLE